MYVLLSVKPSTSVHSLADHTYQYFFKFYSSGTKNRNFFERLSSAILSSIRYALLNGCIWYEVSVRDNAAA